MTGPETARRVRAGLVQMTSSDAPDENARTARRAVDEAARAGAQIVLTPEVTNCVSSSQRHQNEVLGTEAEDATLATLREAAATHAVWVLIGSLALKCDDAEGRFANRSFLIAPSGEIAARYDKIHMFDVELPGGESYRESDGFRPGTTAALAETPLGRIGMTVCYDLRFPYLFRSLARRGAEILTVPAAFTRPTGRAHWEILLRARAIETGCFVLAPAQTGTHRANAGKIRKTWGQTMAISPWGEVLLDMGDLPGVGLVEFDITDAATARARVPSVLQDCVIGNL